jgi:transposase, IS5 family
MCPQPQYHDTGRASFFGDFAYQRILARHPQHFLVILAQLFDWEAYTKGFVQLYKGRGIIGRHPYPPALIFKMLFLSYLYNVSERAMEELADLNVVIKWFLGIAVDEPVPDHSTLTAFKRRFVQSGNWLALQAVFDKIIGEAMARGVQFGELQLLDSVHTQADVNNAKDQQRQERGTKPRDPEAGVVNKGKRSVVQANGKTTSMEITHRGYKTHVTVNAQNGIVTSLHSTSGNRADNKAFVPLREHDRTLGLPTTAYGGDKAYDDTDIFARLEQEGLSIAIALRRQRTARKDASSQRWTDLQANPQYIQALKQRFRVEQPFGIVKRWHGFERCRYLGLARYRLQAIFTFLVHNLKRIVKLLTGVTFRPQAKGRRAENCQPVCGTSWA